MNEELEALKNERQGAVDARIETAIELTADAVNEAIGFPMVALSVAIGLADEELDGGVTNSSFGGSQRSTFPLGSFKTTGTRRFKSMTQ